MHPVAYALIAFGAALAVTGIVLFARMGAIGTSSVKMLGMEFQLGGSALVIFVVGVALVLLPFLRREDFPQVSSAASNVPTGRTANSLTVTPTNAMPIVPTRDSSVLADQWMNKAQALWNGNGQFYFLPESALAYYTRASQLAPRSGNPLLGRAQVYAQFRDFDRALQEIDRAIALSPNEGEMYNTRGSIRQHMGILSLACSDFRQAADLGNANGQSNVLTFC